MRGIFHTIAIVFLAYTAAFGQSVAEDMAAIQSYRTDILKATDDGERLRSNIQFKESLIRFIDTYGLEALVVDSLEKVGFITSHDNSIRFINWNVPFNNGTFQYEALLFEGKRNPTMHILQDDSDRMDRPAFAHGNGDHWFGALYYDIITSKNKELGTYYLLLGWDGHTIESTKKVIDVLYFEKKQPQFGAMVFGSPYQANMRYLMEYTDEAIASLRYHPKEARIVFNNLIPPRPAMKGMYMFYVPSLSFDAFEEEDGKWLFKEDVEVRMSKSNDDAYLDPKRKKNKRKQRSIPNQK